MTGTISRVISDKGFGFIQGEDGQEYFMHRSAVRDGSVFEQLREGQPVVFDAGRGDKGLRAENVRVSWAGRVGAQDALGCVIARDTTLGRLHPVVHSFDDCSDDRSTGTQRAVPLRLGPQVQTLLPREGQRGSERRTEGGGGSGWTIFSRVRDTGRGRSKNRTIAQAAEPSAVEGGG